MLTGLVKILSCVEIYRWCYVYYVKRGGGDSGSGKNSSLRSLLGNNAEKFNEMLNLHPNINQHLLVYLS